MALVPPERWSNGFVRNGNELAATDSTVGARWWHGFLRDPDGRLVVGAGPGAYWGGYVRNAAGALVLTDGKPFAAGSRRKFPTVQAVSDPFPAVETLIDDFNRADGAISAGAGAAIWDTQLGSANAPTVTTTSNRARGVFANNTVVSDADFGPDLDLYATVANLATFMFFTNLADHQIATYDGYQFAFITSSGQYSISRVDNGAPTVLSQEDVGPVLVVGDKIGCRHSGNTLELWVHTAGAWTRVLNASDATYAVAGRIGMRLQTTSAQLDDLSGGTA